jgi:hypothetical protein
MLTTTTIELLVIGFVFLGLRGVWRFIQEERTRKLLEENGRIMRWTKR